MPMRHVITMWVVLTAALQYASADCRFYFASQHDWGNKQGFYLDVEGCEMDSLRLILGVADGKEWRYLAYVPPFQAGKRYEAKAVITPQGAQLFLDGKLVGDQQGGFAPSTGLLELNSTPSWAADLGEYLMVKENARLTIAREDRKTERREESFEKEAARPVPLQLFERGAPRNLELKLEEGDGLTIETTFRCEGADLRGCAPLVDKYGQCRYADWPEKVKSDDDLQADIAREDERLAQMPPPEDRDQYGGLKNAGWSEKATGFYRVVRRNGFWFLITPQGNPCFYVGVCAPPAVTWETTPVTDREFIFEWLPPKGTPGWAANCWGENQGTEYYCLHTANLIRKYGDPAAIGDRATERAFRRLRAWGFCGGGKWGAPKGMIEAPVLGQGATPSLAGHADVFDPKVCETFRAELEKQIAPRRDDPLVIGWSFGNEYDQLIKRGEVLEVLKKPADVPAKRALVDYALKELYGGSVAQTSAAWKVQATTAEELYAATPEPPAGDIEKLRQFYEDRYYEFLYRTTKGIDPNHLYLGNWIVPGWWESEDDWRIHARHLDVIGYDRYHPVLLDESLQRLVAESDKPILCGEFSFPAWYDGLRGFGRYGCWARDDAESGQMYQRWVRDATANPYCIGLMWFIYRDQPITGRGPGRGVSAYFGEHFAFGVITEQDKPKWDLVTRMREANLTATKRRVEASGKNG